MLGHDDASIDELSDVGDVVVLGYVNATDGAEHEGEAALEDPHFHDLDRYRTRMNMESKNS